MNHYFKHCQERFNQKFLPTYSKSDWIDFTQSDYLQIGQLANTQPIVAKSKKKVMVQYKSRYLWCQLSHKGTLKTIYPIDRGDRNKYLSKPNEYTPIQSA